MAVTRRFSIGKVPEDKVFKGQPKVIMDYLKQNPKSTIDEMAKGIGSFEGSRQTPERVIGFYMTTFKKQGLVKAEETVVEDTKGKADEADSGDDDEDDEESEDEAHASASDTEVNDEHLPMEERVEFHEELSAAEPSPGGKFDGLKMTEAVRKVLTRTAVAQKPEEIAEYLVENGYTATKNQVSGALMNLVRQGVAKKGEGNVFSRR